ncbi:hypothetical protein HMPREF1624_06664 [Sporothrix schenckii ATCC 58251]|uniref:Ricin B lectin domain-containing protein n=1 Tax=Sporothrix schenckii (strain ATCC 58251 / de Perez 2211183) TaxID=1391915 RepID=U7PP12_SPOS1|nr:hypothetical protein HMPREF1624_06664 [Sporothrix schenckii ATCC 58251]
MTRALALLAASVSWTTLVAAKYAHVAEPLLPRTVTSLDAAAVAEAQQRDDTATRAFSNVQITTADGRCLFVDKLSGDFRENLTPVQVAACGSTDGQGWDVITAGKHNNVANAALVVSTLTNACLNFDPRRAAGNQVLLFSCGGRADGGGLVTNSQLFSFNGTETGPIPLEPENQPGSCLTVKGNVVDIATCDAADANQSFVFGGAAAGVAPSAASSSASAAASAPATTAAAAASSSNSSVTSAVLAATSSIAAPGTLPSALQTASACSGRTRTVIKTVTASASASASASTASSSGAGVALGAANPDPLSSSAATAAVTGTVTAIPQPDSAVPVSRGGNLSPSAAAEANPVDSTAKRNLTSVTIRAPNGQCLFVDPTAGDFRENLIPVSLVDCSGTPNERWDVVTSGAHNDVPGTALIVSTLTNGCISFDGRRAANDTVNLFSCGGRADGTGQTNADQLVPFIGAFSFALAPSGENGKVCILPGADNGRLVSGACPTNGAQLFAVFP